MSDDFFDPHFDGFPPSEPGEEVEFFDFLVYLFLLKPFVKIDELDGFASEVMAKSFFTDCVVFEVGILIFGFDMLVVDDFQLVNVIGFWCCGGMADQVQELVDVWDILCDQ